MKFTAACIQLNSQNDVDKNIARATALLTTGASKGAKLICLPENAFFMSAKREEAIANAEPVESHKAVLAMQKLVAELKVYLLFGVAVRQLAVGGELLAVKGGQLAANSSHLNNRSVFINPEGLVFSHYDKIHLFDVDIIDGESHRESDTFAPGASAVLADTPWGKLGMTICYDLRFPALFRKLAQGGAKFITVPAAFTHKTGEAHWHALLRARAIENACYIIAPAQAGKHPSGRATYGHSLIIDPWGKILAEANGDGEEIITAEIDGEYVDKIRESLPSLRHDREFS